MLTTVPAMSKMANVTVFVDVTNIAQYTQKQVGMSAWLALHSIHCFAHMPLRDSTAHRLHVHVFLGSLGMAAPRGRFKIMHPRRCT